MIQFSFSFNVLTAQCSCVKIHITLKTFIVVDKSDGMRGSRYVVQQFSVMWICGVENLTRTNVGKCYKGS
jgi:hypothetical protein